MKKKLLVFMVIAALLIMGGCSNSPAEDQTAEDQQATATEEVQQDTATEEPQQEAAADTSQQDSAATEISEQEAKEIALNHAGFKESDVEFTKVGKDMDDGIWQYELEFVAGEMKYEYDINAESGDVMSFESESVYDD